MTKIVKAKTKPLISESRAVSSSNNRDPENGAQLRLQLQRAIHSLESCHSGGACLYGPNPQLLTRLVPGRYVIEKFSDKLVKTFEERPMTSDIRGANTVGMGEFGISKFGVSRTRYIQTFGVGPCVVITLYDKSTKTGMVAHFNGDTEMGYEDIKQSVRTILEKLGRAGVNMETLEARVIGGVTCRSETLLNMIFSTLNSENIKVIEKDILGCKARDVMLDVGSGDVYGYSETIHDRAKSKRPTSPDPKAMTFNNSPQGLRFK